jgi:hypothetical protein
MRSTTGSGLLTPPPADMSGLTLTLPRVSVTMALTKQTLDLSTHRRFFHLMPRLLFFSVLLCVRASVCLYICLHLYLCVSYIYLQRAQGPFVRVPALRGRHGCALSPGVTSFAASWPKSQYWSHLITLQSSYTSVDDLEPLPPGWACAITKEGSIYFIKCEFDHVAFDVM